ncbi:MAG: hypothetical protein N3F65_02355 [Nitrososphaeria archaeon]|nr:hypothetical protein [Nitrososphaeria archaeon]MDW8021105.1 hypothetical protein [Nitrososphaerota archaeon]
MREMSQSEELRVVIKFGDVEAEFSGSPEAVYRQVVSFMEKMLPTYSLAKKIAFSMDLRDLLEAFSDIFAYEKEEGLFFKMGLIGLKSASDAILFMALKKYLEYKLARVDNPSISSSELEVGLPAKKKTILNNLTKLAQMGLLRRLEKGDYAITSLGIKYLADKYSKQSVEKKE